MYIRWAVGSQSDDGTLSNRFDDHFPSNASKWRILTLHSCASVISKKKTPVVFFFFFSTSSSAACKGVRYRKNAIYRAQVSIQIQELLRRKKDHAEHEGVRRLLLSWAELRDRWPSKRARQVCSLLREFALHIARAASVFYSPRKLNTGTQYRITSCAKYGTSVCVASPLMFSVSKTCAPSYSVFCIFRFIFYLSQPHASPPSPPHRLPVSEERKQHVKKISLAALYLSLRYYRVTVYMRDFLSKFDSQKFCPSTQKLASCSSSSFERPP